MSPLIPEPSASYYLTDVALDWALEHAEKFGDTVFLPSAIEYEAIRHNWGEVKTWLTKQDQVKWTPRSSRRILAPKSRFSFRYITQLDPLEYLAFTALLYEVGPQLEAIRTPTAEEKVFSWRFALGPSGQMYDPDFQWIHFTKRCEELALEKEVNSVVVADIADFFPRIYIHPVERVLAKATNSSAAAYCLLHHIRNWNSLASYGLPVGVSGSRIIAEASINDVDQALSGANYQYCRYADDIRIFCRNEREARAALEQLAQTLFENHGHTLQPGKTNILDAEGYLKRFDVSHERLQAESLTKRFHELLEKAGVEVDYDDEIEFDELPEDIQKEIDQLNLVEVFSEQMKAERSDPIVLKILLHRLGQLNIDDVVDDVLKHLQSLGHVMDAVVRYLSALRDLEQVQRLKIGDRVLNAISSGPFGTYERFCLLSLFTHNREFDHEDRFEGLLAQFSDHATHREVILALARAGKDHWFMAHRRQLGEMDPWVRRAFVAACSCMPEDARKPFYKSLRDGADVLEQAIIRWAIAHPFA